MLPLPAYADEDEYTVTFWYTDDVMTGREAYADKSNDYLIGSQAPSSSEMAEEAKTRNLGCFRGWRIRRTDTTFDVSNTPVDNDLQLTAIWNDQHSWNNGVCSSCGARCSHTEWDSTSGKCLNCEMSCTHDWNSETGICRTCSMKCTHGQREQVKDEDASCTAKAKYHEVCSTCGHVFTEVIERGSFVHNLEKVNAVDPTCTADGNIEYYRCADCEKLFADDTGSQEIEAKDTVRVKLGHDWEEHETVPATCGTAGTKAYKECKTCHVKDPENAPEAIPATGEHNWDNHDGVCANEGCDYHCTHPKYNEDHVCEICGLAQTANNLNSTAEYEFTVTITGEGTVRWKAAADGTEESVTSGEPIKVTGGTEVFLIIAPAFGYHVKQVMKNEDPASKEGFSFTLDEESSGIEISCVFAENKTPKAVIKAATVPAAFTEEFTALRNTIAREHKVQSTEIPVSAYDITPCWNGDETDPIANDDITAPIPFTISYPTGINGDEYDFYLYHANSVTKKVEKVDAEKGEAGVSASCESFSPFVLFAAPIMKSSTEEKEPGSKPAEPGAVTKPDPPIISVAPIIDDGTTQTGAILGVDATMEYMRKDSSEGYKPISGKILDDLAAGTYYVRYKATEKTEASEATTAKIEEFYTVRLRLIKGKGTYEASSYYEVYDKADDAYLVRKGGDIEIRFKPDNHYWLYEINVNDSYVGSAKVQKDFWLRNVNRKTTITYGFSDSTSSPKTGDEGKIVVWIAEEIFSLTMMTAIVYYLFRKKETF